MKCPKCGNEMLVGALGRPSAYGGLFWARDEYFKNKIGNFVTQHDAIKNGGISIPVGNGMINNRTKAWACACCKMVLIDCNK